MVNYEEEKTVMTNNFTNMTRQLSPNIIEN